MNKPSCILLAALIITGVLICDARSQSNNATDPTVPGPHQVVTAEYNFGDSAANLPGFPGPVELRGSVTYPADLAGSVHPLIVFLHGRHATCFSSAPHNVWPCTAGEKIIPSYHGYDYIAQNLASNGYVVVSISANGINAADASVSDLGALARAQLIQQHLDLWNTLNTVGGAPFGTLFVGTIDMQNIGTMGHSRGGEGVVRHFQYNQSLGSPYGIKAVFAIGPTDFNREIINRVAFAVTLPYCDGDVRTLEGVHYFDDSRYNVPGDQSAKHALLVMGADHNFYNTIWTPGSLPGGGSDDWLTFTQGGGGDPFCGTGIGNQRLTPAQQQADGLVSVASFFRTYIGHESQFLTPLATGGFSPEIDPATVHASYHPPDQPQFRRDLNRFLDSTSLTTSAVGGAIAETGLKPYSLCGGGPPEPTPCLTGLRFGEQPHIDSFTPITGGLSQLLIGWIADTATYSYILPVGQRSALGFQALQFRAGVNFTDVRNAGVAQDLTITMTDGLGKAVTVKVSTAAPGALFFPPGAIGPVPKSVLNTVRIPLSSFPGLRLFDIRQIDFKFNQKPSGAIMITDLAFTSIPFHP
ncbi:MAG TPA: hypothetical protein VKJ45_08865 [Blastocatellia bacterium]|nr:hypothetical protein [Blastocatellia bacterium]